MKQSEQSVTLSRYFRKLLGLLSSLSGDKQSSQLLWALVLAVTIPAAAQISVTPQRIAGLEASAWPVGDGGPAVNALVGASSLAWDPADNLLIFDSWHNSIRKITPDGTISKVFDSPISGT